MRVDRVGRLIIFPPSGMTRSQPKPRTLKTQRQQDQRRVHRERQALAELRQRVERPGDVPLRDDGARYRP